MADELFQASTSQLSFEKFIKTINQQQAKDLVRSINQFMKNFQARAPDNETDSREVQAFLASMEEAFAKHPLWVGCSPAELDNAVEGLEKYLMTKLYDRTFGQDPLDRERDAVLSRRLAALTGFVTPTHLEVSPQLQGPLLAPPGEGGHLAAAQKELKKMALYKSPRDKLVQILNCCKIINDFITSRRAGAGADDFTPVLIYVTIKAQPEALASNLSFIERYRYSNRLNGEASYFFVQMQGAVAFLETLNPTSLAGCQPDEFISHMLAAGAISEAELSEEQIEAQRRRNASAVASTALLPPPPPPPPPPPAAVAAGGPGAAMYGNPMLDQRQGLMHGGQMPLYGPGAPPPPPPPPSVQPPSYYANPGYPPGAVSYTQPPSYYPPYGTMASGVPYGQHWVTMPTPGVAPPPPPPPPPTTPPPPPPPGATVASATAQQQTSRFVPLPPKSVSELERDGIRLVIKAEAAGELRAKYPYLYYSKESLTLQDVSQLLVSYKELVLRYETLAQAVENNVVKYFTELEAYQAGLRPEPPGTVITSTTPSTSATGMAAARPTSTAALPPPPPPPQQSAPAHPQQPLHSLVQEDLISRRAGAAPPPPPPPSQPPQQQQQQQQQYVPAAPHDSTNSRGPVSASGAGAGSRGQPLDLSQYMPSYQLETEGYAYQAAMGEMGGPAAAAATGAPPAPPSPSNVAGGGSASLIDLLSDYTPPPPPLPPPPPPPSSSAAVAHPYMVYDLQPPPPPQQQPQQEQLRVSLTSGGNLGEDEDGDDKKLTPPGSVRSLSGVELSGLSEGGLSRLDEGSLTAAISSAATTTVAAAAPAASRVVEAGGAPEPFASAGGPDGDPAGTSASLEVTLAPPPVTPLPLLSPATSTATQAATAGASTSTPQAPPPQAAASAAAATAAVVTTAAAEAPPPPPPPEAELKLEPAVPDVEDDSDAAAATQPAELGAPGGAVLDLESEALSGSAEAPLEPLHDARPGLDAPPPPPPPPPVEPVAPPLPPVTPAAAAAEAAEAVAALEPAVPDSEVAVEAPSSEEERQAQVDALVQQLLLQAGGAGDGDGAAAAAAAAAGDAGGWEWQGSSVQGTSTEAAESALDAALALYGLAGAAPAAAPGVADVGDAAGVVVVALGGTEEVAHGAPGAVPAAPTGVEAQAAAPAGADVPESSATDAALSGALAAADHQPPPPPPHPSVSSS